MIRLLLWPKPQETKVCLICVEDVSFLKLIYSAKWFELLSCYYQMFDVHTYND